jgi:hypothetical protein
MKKITFFLLILILSSCSQDNNEPYISEIDVVNNSQENKTETISSAENINVDSKQKEEEGINKYEINYNTEIGNIT